MCVVVVQCSMRKRRERERERERDAKLLAKKGPFLLSPGEIGHTKWRGRAGDLAEEKE